MSYPLLLANSSKRCSSYVVTVSFDGILSVWYYILIPFWKLCLYIRLKQCLNHSTMSFEYINSNKSSLPTDWGATIHTAPPTTTESPSHSQAYVVLVIWATHASWTLPSRYNRTSTQRACHHSFGISCSHNPLFVPPLLVPEQCISTHRVLPQWPVWGRN